MSWYIGFTQKKIKTIVGYAPLDAKNFGSHNKISSKQIQLYGKRKDTLETRFFVYKVYSSDSSDVAIRPRLCVCLYISSKAIHKENVTRMLLSFSFYI